jgi:hypothetical protein
MSTNQIDVNALNRREYYGPKIDDGMKVIEKEELEERVKKMKALRCKICFTPFKIHPKGTCGVE